MTVWRVTVWAHGREQFYQDVAAPSAAEAEAEFLRQGGFARRPPDGWTITVVGTPPKIPDP